MSNAIAPLQDRIRAAMSVPISVGIVLGSGIKALDTLVEGGSFDYSELPNFPPMGVAGHAGVMSYGRLGKNGPGVMVARGRYHLYEGHGLNEALTIMRFFKALNVPNIVLTNAAGGLRPDWQPGDLMLIRDHLNFQQGYQGGHSGGMRFVDPYDALWTDAIAQHCLAAGVPLREGVYVGLLGPSYETMAENRYLQFAGADAVGMSTVPEVALAASEGARVCAISCITNISVTPKGAAETSHQEVVDVAKAASERMQAVLTAAVLTAPGAANA